MTTSLPYGLSLCMLFFFVWFVVMGMHSSSWLRDPHGLFRINMYIYYMVLAGVGDVAFTMTE